jgi:cell division protein FtsZ
MGEMGKAMMGTGEGEGPNRALEAAERAIANPLLDGVSMQGAKGVIISIIGGDDMKLLEVDEAANHIRELVDPNANIIWGSAFNPNLDGKIRVSVVATGIEQTGEMAEAAARPSALLGGARGPAFPGGLARAAAAEPAPAPAPVTAEPAAFDPPPSFAPPPTAEAESAAPEAAAIAEDPLDLTLDLSEAQNSPQPAAEAGELALGFGDAEPVPPRFGRAQPAPGEAPRSAPGSTLFERMANLSRGGGRVSDDDGEPEDGSALNIPRFLGRQNNQ